MSVEFRDPGVGLGRFGDEAWVTCPCRGNAALATSAAIGQARLPRWMKGKAARDRVLRAIGRLRRCALAAGIA